MELRTRRLAGAMSLRERPTALSLYEARLSERIDALHPDERAVLEAASVFGAAFWLEGVGTIAGLPANRVEPPLVRLSKVELVAPSAASRYAASTEHRFRHAITRDLVYRRLEPSRAVVAHRAAAQWLLEAGEREPAILAAHLDRAHEWDLAAPWYRAAAELAFVGRDFASVLALAQHGLRCVGEGVAGAGLHALRVRASFELAHPGCVG